MPEFENLLYESLDDGRICRVTLNRPEAMNALSKALRHRLYEVMTALDADDSVRAVILTGAGTRAFTAGLDLKELGSQEGALGAANAEGADDNPVKAIESCRKPVIGAINGHAYGAGFGEALWSGMQEDPESPVTSAMIAAMRRLPFAAEACVAWPMPPREAPPFEGSRKLDVPMSNSDSTRYSIKCRPNAGWVGTIWSSVE